MYGNTKGRVTSRTESSHSELKSYLHTSTGDLKTVVDNIELMIGNKKDEFEAKLARAAGSTKTKFRHPLLKDFVHSITPPALELVREQIRLADAAAVEQERSGDVGKPCTNRFTTRQRDVSLLSGNLRHQPGVGGETKGVQQTEGGQHEEAQHEEAQHEEAQHEAQRCYETKTDLL
jgi:hypothetical protein